jgi:hypothetical protein
MGRSAGEGVLNDYSQRADLDIVAFINHHSAKEATEGVGVHHRCGQRALLGLVDRHPFIKDLVTIELIVIIVI